ncbi:hypothetical protein [Bradyrhizobium sp. USDA 3256]
MGTAPRWTDEKSVGIAASFRAMAVPESEQQRNGMAKHDPARDVFTAPDLFVSMSSTPVVEPQYRSFL